MLEKKHDTNINQTKYFKKNEERVNNAIRNKIRNTNKTTRGPQNAMVDTQYGKIRGETVRKNTQYRMRNTLRKTYSGNKKLDLNKKTILSNNTRYEQKKT